jgi:hypothetical protein
VISRQGVAGCIPTGGLDRHSRPGRSALGTNDLTCSVQAQRIQESHRSWVVMWSAWRRTFTAFSCFTPGPMVVDEPTPEALISAMRRVELHYSPTRIDGLALFPADWGVPFRKSSAAHE